MVQNLRSLARAEDVVLADDGPACSAAMGESLQHAAKHSQDLQLLFGAVACKPAPAKLAERKLLSNADDVSPTLLSQIKSWTSALQGLLMSGSCTGEKGCQYQITVAITGIRSFFSSSVLCHHRHNVKVSHQKQKNVSKHGSTGIKAANWLVNWISHVPTAVQA